MTDFANTVRDVVAAAGGRLVGKTRLQKTVYILEAAGVVSGLNYTYHYYGPYSEDLASAARDAVTDKTVREDEDIAQWGGKYSIYTTDFDGQISKTCKDLVTTACSSDPVTLELAATAAFLKLSGIHDPWGETKKRKPQKATDERISSAKALWEKLRQIETPQALPAL